MNATPDLEFYKTVICMRGMTCRAAAKTLGVSHIHLSYVLNGRRQSRRLLAAILALPKLSTPKA